MKKTEPRDRERQLAIIALLRLPDPVDLPHRGYRYTQSRDSKRELCGDKVAK